MNGPLGKYPLALLLILAPLQMRAADTTALGRSLTALGPREGWTLEDSLRVFEGNALYELVDGGAALYLEYGFTRAFALRLARGQSRISLELYQMREPEAACGIFSYLAAGSIASPAPYGEQGGRGDGFVLFWKGLYAVTLTTLEGETSGALDTFALAVDRELPSAGRAPEAMTALRRLGASELVFFRGPLGYQKARGLLPAGPLRVGEGAMGTIDSCTVAVLLYENADTCQLILRRALSRLASGSLIEPSGTGALIQSREGLYSLFGAGRRILQVHGTGKSRVQRLTHQLQSAFAD